MKIIRFESETSEILYGTEYYGDTIEILAGDLLTGLQSTGKRINIKKILAPISPVIILGVGLNYYDHAKEIGMEPPMFPVLFIKNPSSITNPNDPIIVPNICSNPPEVDYEAELAVIIGKTAKNVPEEEALSHVLGYTVANDVTARRWQGKKGAGQWCLSKSFDTFCPLGPVIVTADEISNPQELGISCIHRGETVQKANTSDMIFPVSKLISFFSSVMTILPGTVILTGTPAGVGFSTKPPRYLEHGDSVSVKIEKIGELTNPVIAE